jgi:hypothetical protein
MPTILLATLRNHRRLRPIAQPNRYSGFDSALSRNLHARWHFPQENATSNDIQMLIFESKPL